MAAPLIEGRTVGALNVDAVEENAFSESDLRLLVLMANEASRVLESMWMIQQLRKKAEQLQALVLVRQDMAGKREIDEVLRTIARKPYYYWTASYLHIYSEDEDLLRLHSLQDRNGSRSMESRTSCG